MSRYYAHTWDERMRDPDKYPEVLQAGYHDFFDVKGATVSHCKVPVDMPPLETTVTFRSDASKTLNFLKSYQISKNVSLLDFQAMISDPGQVINVRVEEQPTKLLTAQLETIALSSLAEDVVLMNPTKGTIVRAKTTRTNNAYCITDPENPAVKEAEDVIKREGYDGARVEASTVSKAYYGFNLANYQEDKIPNKCGFVYDKKKTKYIGGGILADNDDGSFCVSHRGFQKVVKEYEGDAPQFPLFEYSKNVHLSRALNWVSTTAKCPFGKNQKYTRNVTELSGVVMYPTYYYLQGRFVRSNQEDKTFYYDDDGDLIDYSSKRSFSGRMKFLAAQTKEFRNKWQLFPEVVPEKPFLLASDAMRNVIIFEKDESEIIGDMVLLVHPLGRLLGVTKESELWEVMKTVPVRNLGFLYAGFPINVADSRVKLIAVKRRFPRYFKKVDNKNEKQWFAIGEGKHSYRRKRKVKMKGENLFIDPDTGEQFIQDEFDNKCADRALEILTLKREIKYEALDLSLYQDWKY